MPHPSNVRGPPPKHWNAYRPSYNPSAPAASQHRSARLYPEEPFEHDTFNPNRIPLAPRHALSHQQHDQHAYHLWPTTLHDLTSRTTRAYELVVNYARDSHGGQRWSASDIAYVRDMGKYLWEDIRALKDAQHRLTESADYEREKNDAVSEIEEDVERLREYCLRIQDVISETENLCTFVADTKASMAVDRDGDEVKEGERAGGRNLRLESGEGNDADEDWVRRRSRSRSPYYKPQARRQRGEYRDRDSYQSRRLDVVGRLGTHTLHY
ncbi:Nn.00g044180.m01.CDS01 [Neocucurbitaria sp. VM-36]